MYEQAILSTVEAFVDTCPDIPEELDVMCGRDANKPNELLVKIDGHSYLVTVQKVEG